MKTLIKLICAVILVFSSSVCFAGSDEEESALNNEILQPIKKNFSDSDSLSKLVSNGLIEIQKNGHGKIKDTSELFKRLSAINFKITSEIGKKRFDEIDTVQSRCNNYLTNKESSDSYATFLSLSWGHKIASCDFYAYMVMTAFAFNQLNDRALEKPALFKEAVMVKTQAGTGQHVLVLVEGISGTMFVIDPWGPGVVKLDDEAMKLSEIGHPDWKNPNYPDWRILNLLFGHSHGGKEYYDDYFVSLDTTRWYLSRDLSKLIQNYSYRFDGAKKQENVLRMKDIYNYLNTKFPNWTVPYNKLPFDAEKEQEQKK